MAHTIQIAGTLMPLRIHKDRFPVRKTALVVVTRLRCQ